VKQIKQNKVFQKHFQSRIAPHKKLTQQFTARLELFINGEGGRPLNDHLLKGSKQGLRAFSVSSDIRVIYTEDESEIIFLDIGTHNQVY
jgi:addiction module RelE/StbE family toxin